MINLSDWKLDIMILQRNRIVWVTEYGIRYLNYQK